MHILRRLSTARLLAMLGAVVAIVIGVAAVAVAASSGGPVPAPKPLANAIHDAKSGPPVSGVSGTVTLTNRLFGSPPEEAGPLVSGGSGRVWAAPGGRFRLEVQSPSGDAQIVSDGQKWFAYDPASKTVYRGQREQPATGPSKSEAPPSVDQINQRLGQLSQQVNISAPTPVSIAGQPAYAVRFSPRSAGGLLSAVDYTFDSANGAPLRGAVYAQNDPKPVLDLSTTSVSFGPVDQSVFTISPPAGARVVDVPTPQPGGQNPQQQKPPGGPSDNNPDAVQSQLNFHLSAPNQLAGLDRTAVRQAGSPQQPTAVVTYGTGLGSLVVLERSEPPQQGSNQAAPQQLPLAPLDVGGAQGQELSTALGSVVRFQRGGVGYTVLGFLPRQAVEGAARGL